MKISTVHCFFEESGTFKRQFQKIGVEAIDYDISNRFDKTDVQIDLFYQIERAYDNKSSIFDYISKDDLIMAFFPCIRFTCQAELLFTGKSYSMKKWSIERKLEYDLNLHNELSELYNLITKLTLVCLKRGLRLIIENPYSHPHYLTKYWALQPSIIDHDRTKHGDFFKKPTQYWFINCKPECNYIDPLKFDEECKIVKRIIDTAHKDRSLISYKYAEYFIKSYILGGENDDT